MNVVYAPRATGDLAKIGAYSRRTFGDSIAVALETYIRATVARIAIVPDSGKSLPQRPNVRVVPVIRYPFKIFYTVTVGTVVILHIRHISRKPWLE